MHLALAPFPNSISLTYICHPLIWVLNQARMNGAEPIVVPDHPVLMRVWAEIPVDVGANNYSSREQWVQASAAWLVEHCYEVEREIRHALITPMFLN